MNAKIVEMISFYGFLGTILLQAVQSSLFPQISGWWYIPNLVLVWIVGVWGGLAVASRNSD